MTPQQAIRSVFSQYVGFSGRASRSEYWIWWGFLVVVFVAIGAVALLFGSTGYVVASLVALVFVLPNLAVTVRRLHDTGRSGFWLLLVLIPLVGVLVLLVFLLLDSRVGAQQVGPTTVRQHLRAPDTVEPACTDLFDRRAAGGPTKGWFEVQAQACEGRPRWACRARCGARFPLDGPVRRGVQARFRSTGQSDAVSRRGSRSTGQSDAVCKRFPLDGPVDAVSSLSDASARRSGGPAGRRENLVITCRAARQRVAAAAPVAELAREAGNPRSGQGTTPEARTRSPRIVAQPSPGPSTRPANVATRCDINWRPWRTTPRVTRPGPRRDVDATRAHLARLVVLRRVPGACQIGEPVTPATLRQYEAGPREPGVLFMGALVHLYGSQPERAAAPPSDIDRLADAINRLTDVLERRMGG